MTARDILLYPKDKTVLRAKSAYGDLFDQHTLDLIKDLKDTLDAHTDGIGLAAPQIGVNIRVVTVCLGSQDNQETRQTRPITLVNPKIVEAGDERKDFDGCLSFPGLFGVTLRPHYLRVKGIDENGRPFNRIFSGFDAVVVHHEIDHLDGVLFIDRITSLDDLYRVYLDHKGNPIQAPLTFIAPELTLADLVA